MIIKKAYSCMKFSGHDSVNSNHEIDIPTKPCLALRFFHMHGLLSSIKEYEKIIKLI